MASGGHALVTGGAGFIGSHLAERLLQDGWTVTVIDDCSTGSPSNLAHFEGNPALTVIQSRVSDCADLTVLCARAGIIYHLAAAVGVEFVVQSPVRTIETNLQETEIILVAAAAAKTPVLFTSTSEVYGKSNKPVFAEEDDLLIGPPSFGRWSYACSKLMDEFLAMAYYYERQLPVIIARLFNTVGPRQTGRYGMVLPRFVEAALQNKPLRVFGTGEQTRCFCHVSDAVEGMIRLAHTPEATGQIVNIGGNTEISMNDLARRVVSLLGSDSPIELVPYERAYATAFEDMQRRKPALEKLRRLTGFSPETSLDEIILSVAASMRGQMKAEGK